MDDLLREFLTETSESLDTVDNQLVRFEQDPSDAKILDNIFRLVHTIKGTCGFLGLPRLEALAHAGETLMGKFRDGMPVKAEAVTLILSSIDRIKEILAGLEATETEPEGTDEDLIEQAACDGRRRQPCRGRSRSRARGGRTAGCARDGPGSRQGHAGGPGAGTPAASRRSLARRPRTRLPRDRDRSRAQARAGPRRQTARAGSRACAKPKPKQRKPRQNPRGRRLSPTPPTSRKPTKSPTSRSASTWTRWNI